MPNPAWWPRHEPLVLPHSGITVNISTVYHQAPNPFDRRRFIPPDIYTPLTSDQYRRGIDPVMLAVRQPPPARTALEAIASAAAHGDTAGAEQLLREAVRDEANRYRNLESDVNRLGYDLLGRHEIEQAVLVFEVNTRVFPHSANTHDSLGEALAVAGRRDEAIASYRRALEIDPEYPSAIAALRRLTGGS